MKIIKIILLLVLVIALGIVIAGLVVPNELSMERSVTINAPQSVVADQMFHFKNFNNWNPWYELDTTMKWEVIGEDGAKDAKYSWKGNKKVGEGTMTMNEVVSAHANYSIDFKEPFESHATGSWKVEDAGNGTTKATWSFTTHANFPMNGIMVICGFKGGMAKDFDHGLDKLKKWCEAHAKDLPAADFKIETINFEPHTYACIKKHMTITSMDSFSAFFMDSYPKLGAAIGPNIIGPAAGLFFTWDEKAGTTDMAAAFPVKPDTKAKGISLENVPASKGYQVVYHGGYAGSGAIHQALTEYVIKQGEAQGLVIEEYLKGPGDEKDSTKWLTNIIYLVKGK
jgi:effector-binding domain-containing protein